MSRGCITKRGNGWQIKFDIPREASGIRRTRYLTVRCSRSDAEKKLRLVLSELDSPGVSSVPIFTVGDWITDWLESAKPRVSAKTFERYSQLSRLHIVPHIGAETLLGLSGSHIQRLYGDLRKKGLSEPTILHVHRLIKSSLTDAVRMRVVQTNAAREMRAPRAQSRKALRAMTQNELSSLLVGFQDNNFFDLVAVAASTGMRRGELLALRWRHVDFEKDQILVQESLEETSSGVRFKQPKSQGGNRIVRVDESTIRILDRRKTASSEQNQGLVFPSSKDAPLIPSRGYNISKSFARQARRLGFKSLRFHDLRHTHATLLLLEGVPVNAVASRLGHSSPSITLNVYGHVIRRAEDRAVEVSGDLLDVLRCGQAFAIK